MTYFYKIKLADEHEEHSTYSPIIEIRTNQSFFEIFYDYTTNELIVHQDKDQARVMIYDLTGKEVYALSIDKSISYLLLTSLKPGIYTYVYNGENSYKRGKLLID